MSENNLRESKSFIHLLRLVHCKSEKLVYAVLAIVVRMEEDFDGL